MRVSSSPIGVWGSTPEVLQVVNDLAAYNEVTMATPLIMTLKRLVLKQFYIVLVCVCV